MLKNQIHLFRQLLGGVVTAVCSCKKQKKLAEGLFPQGDSRGTTTPSQKDPAGKSPPLKGEGFPRISITIKNRTQDVTISLRMLIYVNIRFSLRLNILY